jgi:diguanylate cyclase
MLEANRNEVDSLRNELSELRKIANTDSLTSLANRRAFDDRLCYLMGQDEDFVLLLADLDHFKKINDAHGHPIGDDVLKSTALVLHRALGEHTFLARTGGEEFAVILPSVVPNDAFALAERLRLSVQANRIKKNKDELAVTISIGLAHSQFFTASNDVYEAADIALYRSKNDGRNRVSVHALTEDRTAGARYRMYADSNEA